MPDPDTTCRFSIRSRSWSIKTWIQIHHGFTLDSTGLHPCTWAPIIMHIHLLDLEKCYLLVIDFDLVLNRYIRYPPIFKTMSLTPTHSLLPLGDVYIAFFHLEMYQAAPLSRCPSSFLSHITLPVWIIPMIYPCYKILQHKTCSNIQLIILHQKIR